MQNFSANPQAIRRPFQKNSRGMRQPPARARVYSPRKSFESIQIMTQAAFPGIKSILLLTQVIFQGVYWIPLMTETKNMRF